MNNGFEKTLSGILTAAAVAMAITLLHREFGPQPTAVTRTTPKAPDRVSNWNDLIHAGILIGDSTAPVKVVEFADFECPFCRTFDQVFRRTRQQFGNEVALIFLQFPLSTIHRFAIPAARAAECADGYGRFVQFHNLLYEKQDSLGLKSWMSYAQEAGIRDTAGFARCNAATSPVRRVVANTALAKQMGINATPTVIINGWRYYTPPSDSVFEAAIAAVLHGKDPTSVAARASE